MGTRRTVASVLKGTRGVRSSFFLPLLPLGLTLYPSPSQRNTSVMLALLLKTPTPSAPPVVPSPASRAHLASAETAVRPVNARRRATHFTALLPLLVIPTRREGRTTLRRRMGSCTGGCWGRDFRLRASRRDWSRGE